MPSQRDVPILKALAAVQRRPPASFGAPGHGAGRAVAADVARLVGRRAFRADVLTPKGLDDRTETKQVLQRAHALAAEAWGADVARFVTGGSTQSLHTALAAVARPGDTVLIARNAHKAEFSAAVFAGLNAVPIPVAADPVWDLEHGVSAPVLAALLDAHPAAKAALVVSPSYFGVTCDVAALAKVCHARGVPLIVDAAWGAAYGFSPRLPGAPIASGADVAVVSAHKTLAALAQGSVLLARGGLVDPERLALAYELFETTSPSVAILAALDGARRDQAIHGRRIWRRVTDLARRTRRALAEIEGVRVMGREVLDGDAAYDLDETKITLDLTGLGVGGYEADDWLKRKHQVVAGLSDARNLLAILSPGTTAREAQKLVAAVRALARAARAHPHRFRAVPHDWPRCRDLSMQVAMSPSAAFSGPTEAVAYEAAAGRIAAEIIAPAPPGVPRLIPGQRITPDHVLFLLANREAGAFVLDPSDPAQHTVRVVKPA